MDCLLIVFSGSVMFLLSPYPGKFLHCLLLAFSLHSIFRCSLRAATVPRFGEGRPLWEVMEKLA